jgi:DNA repair exonuclease SbcCD ATPase subunit
MRYFSLILCLLLCFCAIAQKLTKEQKKQLKNELKAYRKNLESYQQQKETANKESEENAWQLKKLKDDIASVQAEKDELEKKLEAVNRSLSECEKKSSQIVIADPSEIPMGTVYKVQIGFYKNYDITANFQRPKFVGYEEVEGYKRYIISYFETESEAEQLKNDLRGLGIKDAFVAKYVNRQRVFEWEKNPKYKGRNIPTSWKEVVK